MSLVLIPFLLIISQLNSCIELEMSAPSLPDIASHFEITHKEVTLTITYNLLAFCLAALVYGPLSDAYGRRKIMIIGNGILTLGALGCVVAPSIEWLFGARIVQGLGAATTAVILSAIVADVYKTENATKLYSIMNGIFTTLTALAPVVGGFLTQHVGWRGNYAFVALTCLVAWLFLIFLLPETNPQKQALKFKKILNDYKTLLLNSPFLCASIVPSLLYGCYLAFVAVAPFLYMKSFGLDILLYTLHQATILVAFSITSFFAGAIIEWLNPKKAIYLSLGLCLLGIVLMLTALSPYTMTAFMSLYCIGSAILYPIIFAPSIEMFPAIKGAASSVIIGMRYFLCASLIWFATYFYDGAPFSLANVIFITMIIIGFLSGILLKGNKLKLDYS